MAEDVQYRGWKIERQSYKSERALWHPNALVSIRDGGNVHEHHVAAPPGCTPPNGTLTPTPSRWRRNGSTSDASRRSAWTIAPARRALRSMRSRAPGTSLCNTGDGIRGTRDAARVFWRLPGQTS